MTRPLLAILAVVSIVSPADAQDRTAEIDRIFSAITPATPGCAVGASQRGTRLITRAYGLADVERNTPLGEHSVFDIGSTQKQFVAAAVLLLVEDRRIRLDDDIRKYFPELPDYGHAITVDHLLTHTSGVRDWTGLLPMAKEGTDVTKLILRQSALNFVPGEEWSYSNSGYVLLKELVARVTKGTFAAFAKKRLFDPLGMTSSAYVEDILQAPGQRTLGYQKEGTGWKQFMRLGNERGGGAVTSTAGDLLIWNDALTSGRLGKFVTAKLEAPAALANGRTLTYARGLMVDSIPGGRLVSHSGGAAGYSTWLGRFTDHDLSVVVLCNFDPVSATQLAGKVADLYLPAVDPQAKPSGPVAAPGIDVASRAGLFFAEGSGDPLRLLVNNGRLTIAGGPPLVPVSADRFLPQRAGLFFRSQDRFEIAFRTGDELDLTSMEGRTIRYRRAAPMTASAGDLQAVSGRYRSPDVDQVFEVLPGGKGLQIRFEGSPDRALELEPVAPDTYMQRLMIVRFQRDANGKVAGLDYSNPVVRKLRFARVAEGT
jgi:CubicO group peptidase (beta-lactamase class C family)